MYIIYILSLLKMSFVH